MWPLILPPGLCFCSDCFNKVLSTVVTKMLIWLPLSFASFYMFTTFLIIDVILKQGICFLILVQLPHHPFVLAPLVDRPAFL